MELFETFINGEQFTFTLAQDYKERWVAQTVHNGWYGEFAYSNNPDDAVLNLVKKIERNGK